MLQAQILSTTELGHCHTHNSPVSIQKCNDTLAAIYQTCEHFKKRSTVCVELTGIYRRNRFRCFLIIDVTANKPTTLENHVREKFIQDWQNRHKREVYLHLWIACIRLLQQNT